MQATDSRVLARAYLDTLLETRPTAKIYSAFLLWEKVNARKHSHRSRDFSINYFLPEIKDELVGYVPEEHVELGFELIGSLRKREFSFGELLDRQKQHDRFQKIDMGKLIFVLFECSAIGNIQHRPGGTTSYTFKLQKQERYLEFC